MAGAIQISEAMTFDQLDGFLSQAQVAVPPVTLPGAVAPKTPSILDSFASILTAGAQAYGAYATAQAAKKQPAPMVNPMMQQYPQGYAPSLAPTSAGLSGTQIALIVGGGVLLLGVGALLFMRK